MAGVGTSPATTRAAGSPPSSAMCAPAQRRTAYASWTAAGLVGAGDGPAEVGEEGGERVGVGPGGGIEWVGLVGHGGRSYAFRPRSSAKCGMTFSPHWRRVSRQASCGTVPIWIRHMISSAPASLSRSTYAIASSALP